MKKSLVTSVICGAILLLMIVLCESYPYDVEESLDDKALDPIGNEYNQENFFAEDRFWPRGCQHKGETRRCYPSDCYCFTAKEYAEFEKERRKKKKKSCLLGTSEIRMADFSTRQIKDVKKGDKILDGKLQVAEVEELGFVYTDQNTSLFTFGSNGPIFTADHEFFVNLDEDEIAVQSLSALIASDPNQALSKTIKEFKDVKTLLKLDESSHKIKPSPFTVQPYRGKISQNTKMYNLVSSGARNSYIVNNFVSHEDFPTFSEWPNTYGFLGLFIHEADLTPYAAETPESYKEMAKITGKLCYAWKNEVLNYSNGNKKCPSNAVEYLKKIQHADFVINDLMKNVLKNNLFTNFGMDLNRCSAGFLQTILDNDKYTDEDKNCLMNNLIKAA